MRPLRLLPMVMLTVMIGGVAPAAAQGTSPSPPPKKSFADRLYYGGYVGFSFGDVDYVDISPYVGVDFGHKTSGGFGVFYRHREDDRYDPDLSTSDYGTSVFFRYRPLPEIFLHVEYSWTDFEYLLIDGSTEREDYGAVLVGGGFVQPMGENAGFVVSALYDLSWSDDDLTPYDDPWRVSAGVSVGF